jgi:hypothetical protein
MVDAEEIFKGFCRTYNTFNIIFDESLSVHTSRFTSFFDALGRMLGYRIFSEYTMKKLLPTCPQNLENNQIDIIWGNYANSGEIQVELAVELQQEFNITEYEKDIRKLVTIPANLKVFYCAAKDSAEIAHKIIEELKKSPMHRVDQFLIIVDPWVGPERFGEGKIKGILLDNEGRTMAKGSAEVMKLKDNNQYLRILSNVQWRKLTAQN